jgi:hypothetical protein
LELDFQVSPVGGRHLPREIHVVDEVTNCNHGCGSLRSSPDNCRTLCKSLGSLWGITVGVSWVSVLCDRVSKYPVQQQSL